MKVEEYSHGEVFFPSECGSDQELRKGIAVTLSSEGFAPTRDFEQTSNQLASSLYWFNDL
jgi:hypothetical protein